MWREIRHAIRRLRLWDSYWLSGLRLWVDLFAYRREVYRRKAAIEKARRARKLYEMMEEQRKRNDEYLASAKHDQLSQLQSLGLGGYARARLLQSAAAQSSLNSPYASHYASNSPLAGVIGGLGIL